MEASVIHKWGLIAALATIVGAVISSAAFAHDHTTPTGARLFQDADSAHIEIEVGGSSVIPKCAWQRTVKFYGDPNAEVLGDGVLLATEQAVKFENPDEAGEFWGVARIEGDFSSFERIAAVVPKKRLAPRTSQHRHICLRAYGGGKP